MSVTKLKIGGMSKKGGLFIVHGLYHFGGHRVSVTKLRIGGMSKKGGLFIVHGLFRDKQLDW